MRTWQGELEPAGSKAGFACLPGLYASPFLTPIGRESLPSPGGFEPHEKDSSEKNTHVKNKDVFNEML